ncbi:hypothetical protein H9Q13_07140 [Pontibacter sp. JH31]|uniref:Deoxyribose-phosphate aldolase n=1 Tax=Pontibacter aquaedesilientis TaxID=2766980 RepID=A0ABR7XF61_9BACT|nr:DUF6503 family protein [Pontibacter aquaedesilientis]MBD1396934.1 hypothetical protein [Pontibacter aquaedesilientis]
MNLLKSSILLYLTIFLLLTTSCQQEKQPDAQKIVDEAIAAHGGERYEKSAVSFTLRDRQYRALRDGGVFVYSRTFTDSTGQEVRDEFRNSGFSRTVNGTEVELPEEKQKAYTASVNSVIYFALLPYALNDDAVRKEYLGETAIKGEPYHKVKVTFAQEGGGEGYQDVYIYWFHKQNHTMDYLAYSFQENDGGTRFREAINPRTVGGILFQDYVNYTLKEQDLPLEGYDRAFEAGKLEKVSDIKLESLEVRELES